MIMRRLEYAQGLLCTTSMNIKEVAKKCGYNNEFYFSRIFKQHRGTNPSDFRKSEWTA